MFLRSHHAHAMARRDLIGHPEGRNVVEDGAAVDGSKAVGPPSMRDEPVAFRCVIPCRRVLR